MINPRQFVRLFRINLVLIRHGLDEIILATPIFRPLHFMRYFMFWRWFYASKAPRGVRIRAALEDLGPIFVKFGQMLSTRRDVLPQDIADELALLQDQVAPFPGEEARRIVERAYGAPLSSVFTHFDETPLASASIAQVHAATLLDGTDVVVKVIRPGIEPVIRDDLELMYTVARLAERYSVDARRLHPVEVVQELEKNIFDELDLMREAASASQLRRSFDNSPLLYIPEIYWPHTRRNVMVMERIHGIPVSNVAELRALGVNLRLLAERGVEIFFTQVFRDSFFHADMHPGNIFVNPARPEDPQYIAIDFGIVGTLSPTDHRYLAENFLAFFDRDYRRVAELHVESGWVPPETRVDEFEAAMRTVCEPIFERPLKDISFGALLLRLFQTGRRFEMEVQPQLVLLQKTLLNIEGLGRQLYPELDLWKTAKPYMERWVREQVGVRSMMHKFQREWPAVREKLPEFPRRALKALEDSERVARRIDAQAHALERMNERMHLNSRRTYAAIVGASLLIAAVLLTVLARDEWSFAAGVSWPSWIAGVMGVLVLLIGWPRR